MYSSVKEVHRFRNPISPAANANMQQSGSDFDRCYYSKKAPHTFQIIVLQLQEPKSSVLREVWNAACRSANMSFQL